MSNKNYSKKGIQKEDYNEYKVDRLFNIQKINLEMLNHYIIREDIYDRNDCNNLLQEIISINIAISKKLKYEKR